MSSKNHTASRVWTAAFPVRHLSVMVVTVCLGTSACAQIDGVTPKVGRVASEAAYGFAFLGDLHFDSLDHHDLDWVRENHPGDVRQIRNYSRITEQKSPALLAAVSSSLKKQDLPPFAIIQAGDFVEGLCGSYDLQVQQFKEALAFVGAYAEPIKFLITKGNHDITGPGADKAYADIILPWLGRQLETEISETSYFVEHGGDLFVFFDSYRPDLDWLEEVLSQHPARHVFFVTHQPVVPYNARSQWHIFSKDGEQSRREKLLSILGEYRAIVLSGHLHHYSILSRRTDRGMIVQLALNSVVDVGDGEVELLNGVDTYTPELVDREPGFSAGTKAARRELLKQERPFISYFELADTPGYGLLSVSDEFIDIDIRLRSSQRTWRRLRIEKESFNITDIGSDPADEETVAVE